MYIINIYLYRANAKTVKLQKMATKITHIFDVGARLVFQSIVSLVSDFFMAFVQMFPNAHASSKLLLFALFRSMYRLSSRFFFLLLLWFCSICPLSLSLARLSLHGRNIFSLSLLIHTPSVWRHQIYLFFSIRNVCEYVSTTPENPAKRIHNDVCSSNSIFVSLHKLASKIEYQSTTTDCKHQLSYSLTLDVDLSLTPLFIYISI